MLLQHCLSTRFTILPLQCLALCFAYLQLFLPTQLSTAHATRDTYHFMSAFQALPPTGDRTYWESSSTKSSLSNRPESPLVWSMAGSTPEEKDVNPLLPTQYSESVYVTKRFPSRTMTVGNKCIGSKHPIACQTMTNSDTRDIEATIKQVIKATAAGSDLVRITVQGVKEAEAAFKIREGLLKQGCDTPLVADIHFNPKVAMLAAEVFDKIRVNPGNFVDGRKKFSDKVFSDDEFLEGRKSIEEQLNPLVEKCKRFNRAIRIGTNHGSLSNRILNYFGDSPLGMVKSALEFADICRAQDFHNFCFSMKSSNPTVMVHAYRLLVSEMYKLGWNYPIHLGVTEAGEGEDGRIKSAIGIGTLLQDGIGDTIRVSLTEDPWLELGPCRQFAAMAHKKAEQHPMQLAVPPYDEITREFTNITKRVVELPRQQANDEWDVRGILHRDGSVFSSVSLKDLEQPAILYQSLGCKLAIGMPFKDIATSDSIFLRKLPESTDHEKLLAIKRLQEVNVGIIAPLEELMKSPFPNAVALVTVKQILDLTKSSHASVSLPNGVIRLAVSLSGDETDEELNVLRNMNPSPIFILLNVKSNLSQLHASRRIFNFLKIHNLTIPVIHHMTFAEDVDLEKMSLAAGMEIGALLVDKLGDGLLLEGSPSVSALREMSFNVLQGSRMRNTKTEFISCPSCGRTLFDLQEVTNQIRERTGHLPGVAIAVMGCIVNGVGEMADADFGYVGGAPGKVDLYVGKTLLKRGIPNEEACDKLIELIKEYGRWVEPPQKSEPQAVASDNKAPVEFSRSG